MILFIFRERGREGEGDTEKHWCEREMWIGLVCIPSGEEPATQACALTRNQTNDLLL